MEARFRDLIEGAPDGVVISRDGVVLYANAAALRLLAYDRSEELVGQPMTLFLERDAVMTMRKRLQEMRETGKQPSPYEYEALRRDGARVTAEITSIFIEYDGAPAVLAFARDVTERVKMRARLEQADRLAAVGLIASGIAHEINNPLAFVSLAAEQLERRLAATDTSSDVTKLVRDIRIGVDRIAAIARDLRTYTRNDGSPGAHETLTDIAVTARSTPDHAESAPQASSPRRRVLVVDDERLIVSVVKRTLGDAHDVIGESDPHVALDRLLTEPPFDVVLCDLMMPGLTGIDVYTRVARERPGLERSFIFISGGSFTRQAREFLDTIPNARLTKPFSASDILTAVASLTVTTPA